MDNVFCVCVCVYNKGIGLVVQLVQCFSHFLTIKLA
jgi:hypothetical protein